MCSEPWPVAAERRALDGIQAIECRFGQVQERGELIARKDAAFTRALDFHKPARAEPHNIEIDIGLRVFGIIEIDHGLTADHPHADRGDAVLEDVRRDELAGRDCTASTTATKAAVIAAVRVPPSASMTSAST